MPPMPQPDLEWTVMVYMAGDNDLTGAAITNQIQMSLVGSTDKVHIVGQLDSEGSGSFSPATRFFVRPAPSGGLDSQELMREPNTGSVEDLVNFVRWVKSGHTAKRYLLVLWGHAQGVNDFEDDQNEPLNTVSALDGLGISSSENGNPASASADNPIVVPALSASDESLPPNGLRRVQRRSLLPDVTSDDALTSRELKEALEKAAKVLGVAKVDVLGMDACLMSMSEIAAQVNNHASFMIASEETIPDHSWPYDKILTRLTQEPEMTAEALSKVIVDEYLAFYNTFEGAGAVTLTACDLSKTDKLVVAMRNLGDALRWNLQLPRIRRALIRARSATQTFFIGDYVDLFHLCQNFQITLDPKGFKPVTMRAGPEELQACESIKNACQEVMKVITNAENPSESFVSHSGIAEGPQGSKRLENSHGVSIYFPMILPLYRSLEFSRATQWDSFVFDYMNTVFRPVEVLSAAARPRTASVAAAGRSITPSSTLGGQ